MKLFYSLVALFTTANAACETLDVAYVFPGGKESKEFVEAQAKALVKLLDDARRDILGDSSASWRLSLAQYMEKPGTVKGDTDCLSAVRSFTDINLLRGDGVVQYVKSKKDLAGPADDKLTGYDAVAKLHYQLANDKRNIWRADKRSPIITLLLGNAPSHEAGELKGKKFAPEADCSTGYDYASSEDVAAQIRGPLVVLPFGTNDKDKEAAKTFGKQANKIKANLISVEDVLKDPTDLVGFKMALYQYCGKTNTSTSTPTTSSTTATQKSDTTATKKTDSTATKKTDSTATKKTGTTASTDGTTKKSDTTTGTEHNHSTDTRTHTASGETHATGITEPCNDGEIHIVIKESISIV